MSDRDRSTSAISRTTGSHNADPIDGAGNIRSPHAQTSGTSDARTLMRYDANKKSVVIGYLLLILLGGFGAHRFYLDRAGSGAALLALNIASFIMTFVFIGVLGFIAVGVWIFIDLFLVPGLVRDYNNKLISDLAR